MPERPPLAGFSDVEADGRASAFVSYLDTVNDMPVARAYKLLTYGLLEARASQRLLDLGCGTGDDALALADLVGAGGEIVGIDTSGALVEEARRRGSNRPGVRFVEASAYELPFDDASFDGCRADRLFHHLKHPEAALAEIDRVCRPGARLVISDPDWQTLVIDHEDDETTRALTQFFGDEFQNGGIGHALPRLCRTSGFDDVTVTPVPVLLDSLEAAEQMLELTAATERATEAGVMSQAERRRWRTKLEAANRNKSFFAAYLGLIVSSRVGDSATPQRA